MKVIISGATGFIGGEVLTQALAHPSITSVVCITRRALPGSATSNPKLTVITLTDFLSYPPEILSKLEGAESCIWAMGSPVHKSPSVEHSRKVEIGYMMAAADAFTNSLAPPLKAKGKAFRFVLLGGMFTCRDPNKTLWFLQEGRMVKGEAENGVLALHEKDGSNFEVSIMRPGGVLAKNTLIPRFMMAPTFSIKVDELAAAMVDEVVAGAPGTRTLECDALRRRGKEVLEGSQRH